MHIPNSRKKDGEETLFEEFLQMDIFRPSIFDFAANMFVALGCGLAIALIYRFTYRGASYSPTFVQSLVLLALITAVVILVIGNNLARAFGLVGAMSIIRFRTAVRDVQDIVFIFFSLTIGMAAGTGLNSVAIIGTLFIGLTIVLLDTLSFGQPIRLKHLLHVSYSGSVEDDAALQRMLKQYARGIRLMNIRNLPDNNAVEAFYHLSMRNPKKHAEFIRDLRALPSVTSVNLFFEEEESGLPGA
jgi:uncharacterized membrane protein YhiD involved in acid resistance